MAKLISLIFPVYNESATLPSLYDSLTKILVNLPYDFEVIFVNDGSRDNSVAVLAGLELKDSRVRILELSRNFGKEIYYF